MHLENNLRSRLASKKDSNLSFSNPMSTPRRDALFLAFLLPFQLKNET
jgi:hypothetical protein